MDILEFSIFGKRLSEVTPDDVRAFCQKQNKEGINLDYKKDFSSPKKIAKTIAAMANTLGGWIIVGVGDDGNDKPRQPFNGVDWSKQLPLQVTNLVIDSISPPALPVVHVCEPDQNHKTFVILYIQESKDAPHWLFNENKLCIRIADRTSSTEWERLATADEWEYLRQKREMALNAYKAHRKLLDDLFDAYDTKSEEEYNNSKSSDFLDVTLATSRMRLSGQENTEDKLNVIISPKYPTRELFLVIDAIEIVGKIKFRDTFRSTDYFPFYSLNNEYRIFQRGTHFYASYNNRETVNFFALNQFGMFSFKEKVLKSNDGSPGTLDLQRLLVRFKQNLLLAKKLYTEVGYFGIINIDVLIDGQEWMGLSSSSDDFFGDVFKLQSPLSEIRFTTDTSLMELNDQTKINNLVQEFYGEIANSFRWDPVRRSNLQEILKPFGI